MPISFQLKKVINVNLAISANKKSTKSMKNFKQAFSLIEMSIAILIIGILFVGTIQAGKIIQKSRLSSARAQTASSVVNGTAGLVAWWETTSEKSFIDTEAADSVSVSAWYDINQTSIKKFGVSQSNSTNKPTYKTSVINGLPALKFDGANTYFSTGYNASLNPPTMTLFAVAQPSAVSAYGAVISSRYDPPHTGYMLYAAPNSPVDHEAWFGDGNTTWSGSAVTSAIALSKPVIISVTNSGSSMTFYSNSSLIGSASATFVPNNIGELRIGAGKNESSPPQYYYNGYIGEIILFKRVLNNEERKAVELYLSKKWSIDVAQ